MRRRWPTCSCTQPTTRCVAALCVPVALCPPAESALAAPRDRDGKLVPLPLLSLHDTSLFQALAEALTTTSKGMVGRRLLQCSDLNCNVWCPDWFEDGCNSIVRGLNAAWSAAVKTVEAAGRIAAKAATKLLNEVKNAAKIAAKVATNVLNEVKDAAEKAAKTATKFVEDVGNAFSELGDEIQCATPPLSPKGRSAVLARQ